MRPARPWAALGGIAQSVVLVAAIAAAGPQVAMLLLVPGYVVALAVFGAVGDPYDRALAHHPQRRTSRKRQGRRAILVGARDLPRW